MLTREQFDAALTHVHYPTLGPVPFQPGKYDSPIEERLAWSVSKLIDSDAVALCAQTLVPTAHGAYRVDMLLHSQGKNTVIECDGEEFHKDYLADCARSAALLESGYVDQVVRYQGDVLHHSPDDAAYSLTFLHPEAFSTRALQVAGTRASGAHTRMAHQYGQGGDSTGAYPVFYEVETETIDDTDRWDEEDNYIPATFLPVRNVRVSTSDVSRLTSQNMRDAVVAMRRIQRDLGCTSRGHLVQMYHVIAGQTKSSGW